jgi:hypothetical protein
MTTCKGFVGIVNNTDVSVVCCTKQKQPTSDFCESHNYLKQVTFINTLISWSKDANYNKNNNASKLSYCTTCTKFSTFSVKVLKKSCINCNRKYMTNCNWYNNNQAPCTYKSEDGSGYCQYHTFVKDYTPEQKKEAANCSGCRKYKYIKQGYGLCTDCCVYKHNSRTGVKINNLHGVKNNIKNNINLNGQIDIIQLDVDHDDYSDEDVKQDVRNKENDVKQDVRNKENDVKPNNKTAFKKYIAQLAKLNEKQVVKPEVKQEVKQVIKQEVKPEVKQVIKQEVKQVIKQEVKPEVKQVIKQEVKPEVKQVIKQEVKPKVKQDVKQVIKQVIKQEVKQKIKQEVKQEIKEKIIKPAIIPKCPKDCDNDTHKITNYTYCLAHIKYFTKDEALKDPTNKTCSNFDKRGCINILKTSYTFKTCITCRTKDKQKYGTRARDLTHTTTYTKK